jgi:predicted ATPase
MIERIHVENYKCLRDVTVDLGDFTILIGPNDSGKSSFLEVIRAFGNIVRPGGSGRLWDNQSPANLVWRKDSGLHIVLEVAGESSQHRFVYHLEVPVDKRPTIENLEVDGKKLFWTEEWTGSPANPNYNWAPGTPIVTFANGHKTQFQAVQGGGLVLRQLIQQPHMLEWVQLPQPAFTAVVETLTSSREYQFKLDQLPRISTPAPGIALEASGTNLAAVLDVMQNSADRSAFEEIQKSLHEAIPTLSGIVLPPAPGQAGAKALEFILSGNGQPPVTIPGSLASGGALLLTAFLTLAYTQTPGLLLFEEPENGLHPYRLQMVLDILRKMSRGEVGNRKRQIVLTTHNPLLLNYAKPDEVRVFVRHPEEGTRVIPMTQVPDIDRLLKEFALGELWYLLGEEKLFEEQPA